MHSSTYVSVIMPTFNQAPFISRAIASLQAQSFTEWELLIINDGSTDETSTVVRRFFEDRRVRYFEREINKGVGASMNEAFAHARYDLIAYLPSDDVYYRSHLEYLVGALRSHPAAVLAYSGVRHHYNREASGVIPGYPLQLVQVLHRAGSDRWTERTELVTDDLDTMYWLSLKERGDFQGTGRITCEWVDHPAQRHKIIREPVGGINPYKNYYGVNERLRFHSSVGNFIDEISYYEKLPTAHPPPSGIGALKILLVGELAYNPERVLALEEQGHRLYGLWMTDPYWYNYIGPLPFGHVEDVGRANWQDRVAEIRPDVIYALLNWQAVPFAHEVLKGNPGIPFVWHFKEGPFICLEKGTWNKLIDLYTASDGRIYSSPEMRDWFHQFLPADSLSLVLDGDLPKKDWFTERRSPLLSDVDGEIHTVVPGRPIGLHPETVQALGDQGIHLHFYGDFTHGQWKDWIRKTMSLAPLYLHIHSHCTQENWVSEFSKYDAGWLHFFRSENHGELMRANWDDLNYPARISTLAAAGLPMLQRNNAGHIVATQTLVKNHGLGIFFDSVEELGKRLRDRSATKQIREQVWRQRMTFTFDAHVHELLSFFRRVIDSKRHALRHSGILPSEMEFGEATSSPHREQVVGDL